MGDDIIHFHALADGKASELKVDLKALAEGKLSVEDIRSLSAHIRKRLSVASKLPEWKAVLAFQHRVANTLANEGFDGRGAPEESAFGSCEESQGSNLLALIELHS